LAAWFISHHANPVGFGGCAVRGWRSWRKTADLFLRRASTGTAPQTAFLECRAEGLPKVAERLDLTIFRIHQLNHSSASTSNANFDFGHVVVVKKLVFAIIPCDPYPRPIAGCDCSLIGCAIMPSDPLPDFQLLGSFGSHGFDVRKSQPYFGRSW
jgi:hypothetical protein